MWGEGRGRRGGVRSVEGGEEEEGRCEECGGRGGGRRGGVRSVEGGEEEEGRCEECGGRGGGGGEV